MRRSLDVAGAATPTFSGVPITTWTAAQKCVRQLGLARIAQQWSDLRPHSEG
ncbi:MAG TPA: hypothetical protein VK908_12095 [Jiangellales bacterium]|nr:hypothetical protein [Jiangellales bacterium]